MADEKKVAEIKLAGVALDVICTNDKCESKGKVIETVELTEDDWKVENGKLYKTEGTDTVECDDCDTEYHLSDFIFKTK